VNGGQRLRPLDDGRLAPSPTYPSHGKPSRMIALVTGGSRGLGYRIAAGLRASGMRVAITARESVALQEAADRVGALAITADITSAYAVERAVAQVERDLGPIDLLVNNAGVILREQEAWSVPASDWWHVFEVNVLGTYLCCRTVVPRMIERHCGRIINVGGAAAWAPGRTDSAYSASKAAVYRLGETLAIQLAAYGVAVFTISPGLIRTAMTEGHYPASTPWANPDKAVELVKVLSSGAADALSGRCFHAERDDIDYLIAHAQEVIDQDSSIVRLRETRVEGTRRDRAKGPDEGAPAVTESANQSRPLG